MTDRFYKRRRLNVEIYAARTAGVAVVEGDAEFYAELASSSGGPALELGCGTGRLLAPLARGGVEVTGLDRSKAMLGEAKRQLKAEAKEVRRRVTLEHGDMTSFELGREFGLVYIAFRSFMMLDTVRAQRACLTSIYRHLAPGGRVAIDLFDPLLGRMEPGKKSRKWASYGEVVHPKTLNVVRVEVSGRSNDPLNQVFEETWRFTEVGPKRVVRRQKEILRMRWTYRNEMRYLLELCGFTDIVEYSDYKKSPPAYGKEQIWVATKAGP
ncbi:MAG: class I SAM-dependent methyltransferase [bacterium]